MTAVFLSGMLASIHPATSQTTSNWYLGFATGRVVAFGVENGAARIGMVAVGAGSIVVGCLAFGATGFPVNLAG